VSQNWSQKSLGEVLKIQNGYAFDSANFNPTSGLPLIRIRSLKSGVESQTRYSGTYDDKYLVRAGDLLVGMDGEFGCYEWKGEPSLLNQRVCRLQEFSSDLIPRFLFYGLNRYLKAIEDVTGFATVKHLSSKQILEIKFPLPPIAEQKRIVKLLDEAFAAIDIAKANTEKNLKNAREVFESHLNSVFTQRGEGWVKTTLREVLMKTETVNPIKSPNKEFEYIDVSSVSNESFKIEVTQRLMGKDAPSRARKLVRVNDVLFATIRPTLKRIALVPNHLDQQICSTGYVVLRAKSAVEPRFVYYSLFTKAFLGQMETLQKGASYPAVTEDNVKAYSLAIPQPAEQIKIVAKLDTISEITKCLEDNYTRKILLLEELKKSFLHQAFSGNL